jgi:hypothetical protein
MRMTLLTMALIAGTAAAGGPEPKTADQPAVLQGPRVSTTNVTGTSSTFSASKETDRSRMMGVDRGMFREALLSLRKAPGEIRPTPEQEAAIGKLMREFQQKERAFQAKHGRELRQLRAQMPRTDRRQPDAAKTDKAPQRPSARPTDKKRKAQTPPVRKPDRNTRRDQPPVMDEPMSKDDRIKRQAVARERLEKIMVQRPNAADLEKPVRAILTVPQRKWLDEQISIKVKERFEKRSMERYRREAQRQFDKQDERAKNMVERLPPRVRKYIESLPPEDRPAALEKLRERRERGKRATDGNRTDRKPGAKKPPSVDDVDVPKPSGGG